MGVGCNGQVAHHQMTPEVAVVTVTSERLVLTSELPGRTAAFRVAEIRPQVNGLIEKRLFTEGADVEAGQVLYQIEPESFRATLDTAEASLARAKAGLEAVRLRAERYKGLLADQAISQQDYDDAVAALKQSEGEVKFYEASVKTARINMEYTNVKAPVSGRIGKSSVTDGALVVAYQPQPLSTIQQLDPIYVDVAQPTSKLLMLRRRMAEGGMEQVDNSVNSVKLVLEDGSVYAHEGKLQFQDVTVDPTTGSVIVRAVFPNPDGLLLPGMFVRAVVPEGVNETAILVPQQGVARNTKGEPLAMLVDSENKIEVRQLTLDRAIGDKWVVLSGLNSGDRVVVEGVQRIRPGVSVNVAQIEAPDDKLAQVQ
ncbi:MAG: efflux RND transporter periplasmic adaptor subunit [Lentisphaerae bacterium]|nr:efflux RND transporter periplasmic adaptor subunit [Lentisphaerota bacterium]